MFDFVINVVTQYIQLIIPLIGMRIIFDLMRIFIFGKETQ